MKKQQNKSLNRFLFTMISLFLALGTFLTPSAVNSTQKVNAASSTEVVKLTASKSEVNTLGTTTVNATVNSNGDQNFTKTPIIFTIPKEFNVTGLLSDPNKDLYTCSQAIQGSGETIVTCELSPAGNAALGGLAAASAEIEVKITAKAAQDVPNKVTVNVGAKAQNQTTPATTPITINPIFSNPQPIAKSTTGAIQSPGLVDNPNFPGVKLDGWGDGGSSVKADGSRVNNTSDNFAWHVWINQYGNAANKNGHIESSTEAVFSDKLGSNLAFVGGSLGAPETDFFMQYAPADSENSPKGRMTRAASLAEVTAGSNKYFIKSSTTNSFEIVFDFNKGYEYFTSYRTKIIDITVNPSANEINHARFLDIPSRISNPYDTYVYGFHEGGPVAKLNKLLKSGTVTPAKRVGDLKISKIDEQTKKAIAGAVFKVTGPDNYSKDGVTAGADGTVTLTDLAPGEYTVVETAAPSGYKIDSTPKKVTVKGIEELNGKVAEGDTIHYKLEVDSYTLGRNPGDVIRDVLPTQVTYAGNYKLTIPAKYSDGVTPNAISAANFKTTEVINNNEITVTINDALPEKAYFYIEFDVTVNPGTYNTDVVNTFTFATGKSDEVRKAISEDASKKPIAILEIANTKQTGGVKIIKKVDSATGAALPNVEFSISGKSLTGEDVNITGLVTGADGTVTTSQPVLAGTYTVKEVKAPFGYELAADQQVTVEEGKTTELTFVNKTQKGTIKIKKVDDGGKPLEGATFKITQLNPLPGTTAYTATETSKLDADGNNAYATFTDAPVQFEYTVEEISAPAGYNKATNIPNVWLLHDAENLTVVPDAVVNTKQTGGVKIIKKVDSATGAALPGVEFSITGKSTSGQDVNITGLVTGTDGTVTTAQPVPAGTYTVKEVKAPFGYELAADQQVTVEEGKTAELTFINKTQKGTIKIKKVDDGGQPLEGATFKVTQLNPLPGTTAYTATATSKLDADGSAYATFTDAPVQFEYSIEEISAPAGYNKATNIPNVWLLHDAINLTVVPADVINTKQTGGVKITKKVDSATGAALPGVEFSITGKSTSGQDVNITGLVTANDGTITTSQPVPAGTYTVKEVSAPFGYELAADQQVTVEEGKTAELTFINKTQKGTIKIKKVDDGGKPLEGATFKVTQLNPLPGTTAYTATATSKLDADGKNAYATFTDAPVQFEYTVEEISAPAGYTIATNIPNVWLLHDAENLTVVPDAVVNKKQTGGVKITKKVDSATGAALPGVEFSITGKSTSGEDVNITGLVTGTDGTVTTAQPVPAGTYTVKEVSAPFGYELAADQQVTVEEGKTAELTFINKTQKGTIKIKKVDDGGKPLEGATFKITQLNPLPGTTAYTATATSKLDADGKNAYATFTDAPVQFEYTVEEISAPAGYTIATNIPNVWLLHDAENLTVVPDAVVNKKQTGGVKITKKVDSATGAALPGVEFSITGKSTSGEDVNITGLVTGTDGTVTTAQPVLAGTYTVKEVNAPFGYELAAEQQVTVEDGKTAELTFINKTQKGTIKIKKVDDGGKPLEGATFKITQLNPLSGTTAYTATATSKLDADGNNAYATFTDAPVQFEYTVEEISAPAGYTIATNIPNVWLLHDADNLTVVPDAVVNKKQTGNVKIVKVDKDSKAGLKGAEFTITGKSTSGEDVNITGLVTGTDGTITTSQPVPVGKYTVTETKAPAGYNIDTATQEITVEDGKTAEITFQDTKQTGKIEITKQDKKTQTKLAGAEFDVKDVNGQVVDHVTTGKDGVATTKNLPLGVYSLVETKAPTGFVLNTTPINVTLSKDSETVKQTIDNTLAVGKIIVSKFDKKSGNRLSGMVFKIRNVETGTEQTIEMKEHNVMEILDVQLGTYEIVEITAPEGYEIDSTVHTVKVTKDGEVVKLDMYDSPKPEKPVTPTPEPEKKTSVTLPATGAKNTPDNNNNNNQMTLIALLTSVVALASMVLFRRKVK